MDIDGRKIHVYKIYINCGRKVLILPAIRKEQGNILNTAMVLLGPLQACNLLDKRGFSP